jgi:hypothetical protein
VPLRDDPDPNLITPIVAKIDPLIVPDDGSVGVYDHGLNERTIDPVRPARKLLT